MSKKSAKIIIPLLMLSIIVGIYFYKNYNTTDDVNSTFALEINSVDLAQLTSQNLPIIIDFGSDSCIPCKQMYPALVSVNSQMQDKALVKFVDVWKNTNASNNFPIQVIPTQVFYTSDGNPYIPSDTLANEIDFTMYSHKDTGNHLFTVHQGPLSETQLLAILKDMGVE